MTKTGRLLLIAASSTALLYQLAQLYADKAERDALEALKRCAGKVH